MNMAFLLLVAAILWLGVFGFVWMLDRKTVALEQRIAQKEREG
jgi:CcmD family protein